jgi:hypothetical protein
MRGYGFVVFVRGEEALTLLAGQGGASLNVADLGNGHHTRLLDGVLYLFTSRFLGVELDQGRGV